MGEKAQRPPAVIFPHHGHSAFPSGCAGAGVPAPLQVQPEPNASITCVTSLALSEGKREETKGTIPANPRAGLVSVIKADMGAVLGEEPLPVSGFHLNCISLKPGWLLHEETFEPEPGGLEGLWDAEGGRGGAQLCPTLQRRRPDVSWGCHIHRGMGRMLGSSAEGLRSLQPRAWGSPSPGILEVCHAPGVSCSLAGCGGVRIRGGMDPAEHSLLWLSFWGIQLS